MKTRILLMISLLGMLLGSCSSNLNFTTLGVDKFETFVARPGVQLVDVRTPAEYLDGHLDGAQNIDMQADDFIDVARARLDRRKPVAVYCRSGKRSARAAQQLANAGFKVINLAGGINDWKVADKKIVK